jgi:rubrerythrin
MDIESAITTALQFENRVVRVYEDAARNTLDPAGRRMFEILVKDERSHVNYLESKLGEWRSTGRITPEKLSTLIPNRERIEEAVRKLRSRMATSKPEKELALLRRALEVEVDAGDFYRGVVRELPAEDRPLFQRFVEIEQGHQAIVQAEIDSVSGLGFWFDMREFDLEAG